jgi:NitT/TauT family transport system substrate-binding protein
MMKTGWFVARLVVTIAVTGLALSACATQMPPAGDAAHAAVTPVTVVMGFTQNVQFAPFYAAQKLGYYRHAGLAVKFNYANEPSALQLLSNGSVDFVDSGGDEVLAAGASGLKVKYVMTQYSRFPSALFFLKSSGIRQVSDLEGKTVGVPEKVGASYYGLLALLAANHVPVSKVNIEVIGFDQVAAVASGQVAAAMGYAPNEPVELRSEGKKVGEFDVYRRTNIAGAGLATSDALIAHKPSLVRAFVGATLRGLQYVLAHRVRAFSISRHFIPGMTDPSLQQRILDRAIAFWRPAGVALGRMDPSVWNKTERVLYRFKIIPNRVKASSFYSNAFVR